MVGKKFKKELLITPLAAAKVLEEIIPEETDTEALKETIKFAGHLAIGWNKVWELAEKRLEVIEEVGRIVCQSKCNTERPSK
jgi:hypothetical protein